MTSTPARFDPMHDRKSQISTASMLIRKVQGHDDHRGEF